MECGAWRGWWRNKAIAPYAPRPAGTMKRRNWRAVAFTLSIRAADAIYMGVGPVFYVQLPFFIYATALKHR
jgi:hypothetical protein